MFEGLGLRRALSAPSPKLGLCALGLVAACSVINHFDDVKPLGGGGSSTMSGSSGATGGPSGGGDGTGGAGVGGSQAGQGGVATGGANTGGANAGGANAGGANAGGASMSSGGAAGTVGGRSGAAGAGGVVDAGMEAGPPLQTCRFVIGTPMGGHRKLDDFSSLPATMTRTMGDRFFMLPTGNGTSVRILVQLDGGQNNYLEYFASDGGTPMGMSIAAGGRLLDARKIDMNTTGALVLSQAGGVTQFVLHRFDDATMNANPVTAPITAAGDIGSSGNAEAEMAPTPDGSIAVAMSFQTSPTTFQAAFGLYAGAPVKIVPLFTDGNSDVVRPNAVLREPPMGLNFGFYGSVGGTQVEYQIPDSARAATDTFHRTMPSTGYVLMSQLSPTMGKLDFATVDFDIPMMRYLRLYVGQTDVMQAYTFDPTMFTLARMATSH